MGRKKPYLVSLLFQEVTYLFIYFSTNLHFTIFCYLLIGLAAGGRVAVGTMYLGEFIPLKYQTSVITGMNIGDASVLIFHAIWYGISPNWAPLHFFGLCYGAFIIFLVFNLPESPKFLYAKKRFDEARVVFMHISIQNGEASYINSADVKHMVFDTEEAQNKKNKRALKD